MGESTQSRRMSALSELHTAVQKLHELTDSVAGAEPEDECKEQVEAPQSLAAVLTRAFNDVEEGAREIRQCVERIEREMQPFGLGDILSNEPNRLSR